MELAQLLAQWELWDGEINELDGLIRERFECNADAQLLATLSGVSCYMGLAIASRIGPIGRFPSGRSLANFFGLTPGCRNSGEATDRLGSITKEGSRQVRFLLGQLVLHVLKRDAKLRAWYKGIKKRRGSKIARVAVMRRLTVIMWHMLTHREAYLYGGPPSRTRRAADDPAAACQPVARATALTSITAGPATARPTASTGSSSLSAAGRT